MTELKDIFAEPQTAPPAPAVVRATDLTGVVALKHDELSLLTDALGVMALPEWLPDLRIRNLRLGEADVDLRFAGRDTSLSLEVLRRSGDIDVVVRL